jgi:hypothetical protein
MPATSQEPRDGPFLETDFNPGSSGRRKRVSARHQVKRLDRTFEELAPRSPVRQKKQVFFVRCGSLVRSFIGLKALGEIWS